MVLDELVYKLFLFSIPFKNKYKYYQYKLKLSIMNWFLKIFSKESKFKFILHSCPYLYLNSNECPLIYFKFTLKPNSHQKKLFQLISQ